MICGGLGALADDRRHCRHRPAPETKRTYRRALTDFFGWCSRYGSPPFRRRRCSASGRAAGARAVPRINVRVPAVRKLARETARQRVARPSCCKATSLAGTKLRDARMGDPETIGRYRSSYSRRPIKAALRRYACASRLAAIAHNSHTLGARRCRRGSALRSLSCAKCWQPYPRSASPRCRPTQAQYHA